MFWQDHEKVYIYDNELLDEDIFGGLDPNKLATIMEGGSSVSSGGRPSIIESDLPSCIWSKRVSNMSSSAWSNFGKQYSSNYSSNRYKEPEVEEELDETERIGVNDFEVTEKPYDWRNGFYLRGSD